MAGRRRPDFGVRAERHADQLRDAGVERGAAGPEARRSSSRASTAARFPIGAAARRCAGDVDPGTRITLMVARDNVRRWSSRGTYEPKTAPVHTDGDVSRPSALARAASISTRDGNTVPPRRAASPRSRCCSRPRVRFREAGQGRRQRPHRVRRHDQEGRRDADAMGGARQRPDDAVRRRTADLSSLTRSPAGSPRSAPS